MSAIEYRVLVAGTIPADLLAELGDLDISIEPAETVLRGVLPDQSALFGLLQQIHMTGLRLVEVRKLPDDAPHEGVRRWNGQ